MKKILPALLYLTLSTFAVNAQQDQEPTKKIIRSEDDKLYINKDLGIYLWLSVSPDPNSEKFRLMSDTSKKYTNPMYLDTEGYNTVRSPSEVDTSTKKTVYPLKDIIFEVYADGIPPITIVDFVSKTNRAIEGKKYYGGDLTIGIKSEDGISGVDKTMYSLNKSPLAAYSIELKSFKEGENTLEYYAIDKVGNKEEIKTKDFNIDNTPPKTEYEIEGMLNEKFVAPDATIRLKSTDNLSGVKAIYYQLNKGPVVKYVAPIPVKLLGNNEGKITFWAEDNLGNQEEKRAIGGKDNNLQVQGMPENVIFEFYVDKDPPVVKLDIVGDSFKGKNQYVSKRSKFKISADDEKSGVDKIYYSLNSTVVNTEYKNEFSLEKEELTYVRIKAADFVGNSSAVLANIFYPDMSAPSSSLVIGSPKLLAKDTLFVSDKTPIKLLSSDALSGVSKINFLIDNGNIEEYKGEIKLGKEGTHIISYFAIDNVNNQEDRKTKEIFLDNTPPQILYHFSVGPIGGKTVRDEPYTIYPSNVMLYIAATDADSGGEHIEYFVNEGQVLTSNPVKNFKPGNYEIKVNAYDELGNMTSTNIKFAIEE